MVDPVDGHTHFGLIFLKKTYKLKLTGGSNLESSLNHERYTMIGIIIVAKATGKRTLHTSALH